MTSDQTIFESTHVIGALEIHCLEKVSSAFLAEQWSGSFLIRGYFGLGWSGQRQFRAHTILIRGHFKRVFFQVFYFSFWFQHEFHDSNKISRDNERQRNLIATDTVLRCVRFSFGFINTILVLDRGDQTKVTSDQTIFESTHVIGALELHCLEKVSSAFLAEQWSGSFLIRGHFGLGWSGQRQFRAHTILIRGHFKRVFFMFFIFLSAMSKQNSNILISDSWGIRWFD